MNNQDIDYRISHFVALLHCLAAPGKDFFVDLGTRTPEDVFRQKGINDADVCSLRYDAILGHLKHENAADHMDIYMRPARGAGDRVYSYVFLDDLKLGTAKQLARGKKHVLVNTSSDSHHLWLATDNQINEATRKEYQKHLAAAHGGDPGSTSGDHFGRLPGFKNWKRGGCWVNLISFDMDAPPIALSSLGVSHDASCDSSPLTHSLPQGGARTLAGGVGTPGFSGSVSGSGGSSDESHKEFRFACESLRHNVSTTKIIENIAARALDRGKRKTMTMALDYAEKLVAAAARAVG
ncbi:MAG: DNA-primase RepB domain-containing protein [Pseudomonadota bacterium]